MKFRRATAIVLSLAMAFSLTACGGTEKAQGTASAESSESQASGEVQEKAEENIPTLTLFVDETWWPYDKWEGAVPEEFERRLGVKVEVTRAADDNQLALMVASGDMPDIICSYRYQYLADSQVCYPLDELHEEYPEIPFEVDPAYQFVNKAPDGHYYTIGCGFLRNMSIKNMIRFFLKDRVSCTGKILQKN